MTTHIVTKSYICIRKLENKTFLQKLKLIHQTAYKSLAIDYGKKVI